MIDNETLDFDWPDIEIDWFVWQWSDDEGTQQNQRPLRTNYESADIANHDQCAESPKSKPRNQ